MGAYSYQALDAQGKKVKGVLEADTDRDARQQLRAKQLKPISISSKKTAAAANASQFSLWRGQKLSTAQLSLFSRQLASLVQSGMSLDEALHICARQTTQHRVQRLVSELRSRVLEGRTLAQAMSEHPLAFNRMYCAMVKAGETAGHLGQVLERLAIHTETGHQSQQKLKNALVYPLVLFGVSIAVVMLLMSFVVPRLVSLFTASDRALPPLTQALITTSDFLTSSGFLVLILTVIGVWAGFLFWLRQPGQRQKWHRLLLKVPGLNNYWRQVDSTRFASTLSILLNSGVPLLDALRIASQVLDNEALQEQANHVAARVQEGAGFSRSLAQSAAFPPLLVQMAANGEANGTLAEQLGYAASNQERELNLRMTTLMTLLEPLTIVIMGGVVTLIMLAVLLPVFDINSLI